MHRIKLRFGTKLILFICLITAALSLFTGWFSINKYQSGMEAEISQSVTQAFIQANTLLDYNIREYERLLSLAANDLTIQKTLTTIYDNQFDWFLAERDLNTATHAISATHSQTPDIHYYFLKPQKVYISAAYTSSPYLSEDTLAKVLDTDGIGFTWDILSNSRIEDGEERQLIVSKLCMDELNYFPNAVAYISIPGKNLFQSLEKIDYGYGQISVSLPDDTLLYTQRTTIQISLEDADIHNRITSALKGYYVQKIEGKKYLVIFNRENKYGWILTGFLPYQEVMNSVGEVRTRIMLFTIISTIICLLLLYLFIYQNTKKISVLSSAMEKVDAGSLDVNVPLHGDGEVEQMASVFTGMLQKIKQQLLELEESSRREHKLELLALQEQINPHLLYNTLSTINSYAEEIEAEEISELVLSLITYYNLSLSNGMEFITIHDELRHVKAYVTIMQKRFGDSLEINISCDPAAEQCTCPKMILQPFIENSIYHGFSANNGFKGTIQLQVCISCENIEFIIEDNGCGMTPEKIREIMSTPGQSYALKNIDSRVKLYYGDKFGLHIESNPGKGSRFTVVIPSLPLLTPNELV